MFKETGNCNERDESLLQPTTPALKESQQRVMKYVEGGEVTNGSGRAMG